MTKTRVGSKTGYVISDSELQKAGLEADEGIVLVGGNGFILLRKQELTAMDIIHLSSFLSLQRTKMLTELIQACNLCSGCGYCAETADGRVETMETVTVSDHLRRKMNIPLDAKLQLGDLWMENESGVEQHLLTISPAPWQYDLSDVPQPLLRLLKNKKVCLGDLDELLQDDEVIFFGYGNNYLAAKQDFAVRADLVDPNRIFSDEQLIDIYNQLLYDMDEGLIEFMPKGDNRFEAILNQIKNALPDDFQQQTEQEADMSQEMSGM